MRTALLALLVACGDNIHRAALDATPDVPNGTPITVMLPAPADPSGFIVAYQDGGGAWQAAPPPNGDVYTFYVQSDRWGFASTYRYSSPGTNQNGVSIFLFTVSERTTLNFEHDVPPPPTGSPATVSGTVTGLPATTNADEYSVTYDWGIASFAKTQTTGTFTLTDYPGPHDLFAIHWAPSRQYADGIAIVRNVVAPTTTASIDWGTAGISLANVSIDDTAATRFELGSDLFTGTSPAYLSTAGCMSNPCAATISGLPPALVAPTDVNHLWIVANDGLTRGWQLDRWASSVDSLAITAPAPLANVVFTADPNGTPYPRIATTWEAHPGAAGYDWSVTNSDRAWYAYIGLAYAGSSPAFEMPDLSQIPGWSTDTFGLYPENFVQPNVDAYFVDGYPVDCLVSFCEHLPLPAKLVMVRTSGMVQLPR